MFDNDDDDDDYINNDVIYDDVMTMVWAVVDDVRRTLCPLQYLGFFGVIDNHHDGNNGNYDWSCGQDNYIVMFDGKG